MKENLFINFKIKFHTVAYIDTILDVPSISVVIEKIVYAINRILHMNYKSCVFTIQAFKYF